MKRLTPLYLYVVISLFTISPVSILADEISGRIVDAESGYPIPGATIIIENSSSGGSTDSDGYFKIVYAEDSIPVLLVSSIGYYDQKYNTENNNLPINIKLKPRAIRVGNISVTASRFAEETFETQQSITVATEEEFNERAPATTAEILREEPGILVQKTTAGHGAPIIRGLIGKYVLLAYNGIRLNKPTFRFGANQYLNTIDMKSLERIEIARGPSSVMYGSDAIGGVVNTISRAPIIGNHHLTLKPNLATRYSSVNNGRSMHMNLDANYDKVSVALNITYKKTGDLRAGGDIGKQEPTGWDEFDYSGRLFYLIDDHSSWTLDYLSVRQNDVPRYDKYASGDFEKYIYDPQNRNLFALTYDRQYKTTVLRSFKFNISYQKEHEGKTTQRSGSDSYNVSTDNINTLGTYIHTDFALLENHRLSIGSEYYHDKLKSEKYKYEDNMATSVRPEYPDNSRDYTLGIYMQDDWKINQAWRLTLGARYNRNEVSSPLEEPFGFHKYSFEDITGSIALSCRPNEWLNIIGRWSQGFRAPSFNDLLVLKYSSSGVDAPSPGLESEHSNNFEIGAKVRTSKIEGELFLFYNNLNDLIDRQPGSYNGLSFFDENDNGVKDENEFAIYQKFNVGKAEIYGIEYRGVFDISSSWVISSNCFWTYGRNITNSEPLSRIPPVMGMAGIKYIPNDKYWAEFYFRAASDQRRLSSRDIDDDRIEENGTPGWTTLNLRGQYKFKMLSANINFENILDYKYKEHGSGIYSAGRNFVISLSFGY